MAPRRERAPAEPGVDWLTRDLDFVEGLDHLGVQVVSTNIYSRLVPGISNLTDRARYFGFYSWVLDSFARLAPDKSPDGWRTWVRRHEFALSAAGVVAERDRLIPDAAAGGLIGAIAARRRIKDKRIDIDDAARIENGKAAKGTYFRNREGGYSQYYKGPMTALGLLRLAEGRKAPDRQLTAYAGAKLAAVIEKQQVFRDLREIAASGADVAVADLTLLGQSLHPGAMSSEGDEAALLRSLLLGTNDALCVGQKPVELGQRRRSLALLLDYLRHGDEESWTDKVIGFRWAVLESRLGDGRVWDVPTALRGTAAAWAAYSQNELFNYALECFFFAALELLDGAAIAPRALAAQMADWACAPARDGGGALPARLGAAATALAAPANDECWGDDGTYTLCDDLEQADGPAEHAARAARLLLRVAIDRDRFGGGHPFATIPQGDEMAAAREIHLRALWERVDRRADQDTRAFFEELVLEWVLYRHLRVATRKLANQGDYTYRVRPEEGVLVKCGDFRPTFTNPRLRQSLRMMADVGLASADLANVTPEGDRFLQAVT